MITLCVVDIGHGQTVERPFDDGGDLFGRVARWVRKMGIHASRGHIIEQPATMGDAIAVELDDTLRRDCVASEPELMRAAAWACQVWSTTEGKQLPDDWRDECGAYVRSVLDARRDDRHMAETLADAGRAGRRGGW